MGTLVAAAILAIGSSAMYDDSSHSDDYGFPITTHQDDYGFPIECANHSDDYGFPLELANHTDDYGFPLTARTCGPDNTAGATRGALV